jgi:ABC-type glycerol-3-phosphate transport system permease component
LGCLFPTEHPHPAGVDPSEDKRLWGAFLGLYSGPDSGLIVEWNVQMAAALIAALPTLLVYIFLGRYFMQGLMAGLLEG